MTEPQVQREERVYQQLAEARIRIESDIAYTADPTMKRIEADAAAIVALTIVSELLPAPVREQVQAIICLHEHVWNADEIPASVGITPRKPIGERLLHRFAFLLRNTEDRDRPPRTTYPIPPTP